MTTGRTRTMTTVASGDGTRIACFGSGDGPPLVLVHGVLGDHSRWEALRPELDGHATVYAIDRRGRGASGDHQRYDVEREFEDVAAVVDALAGHHGGAVDVYGHSGGAAFALGAATLINNLRRLVLYEPPTDAGALLPEGLTDRLDTLLADGDDEAVVETFCREVLAMPDPELELYRQQPSWAARVAAAHTLPRELAIPPGRLFDEARAARVTAPTLLLTGAHSPTGFRAAVDTAAAAIPGARVQVLDGQAHTADVVAPTLVAQHLLAFLGLGR
jgi:pimeloyl-ACP methyl ester carboxylesterase